MARSEMMSHKVLSLFEGKSPRFDGFFNSSFLAPIMDLIEELKARTSKSRTIFSWVLWLILEALLVRSSIVRSTWGGGQFQMALETT